MLVLYIPSCLGLIVIVLLQKGKGVGFAGAFGVGGGSDTVFGPRSARSLPQRITYAMAGIFMVLALLISMVYGTLNSGGSAMSGFFGNETAPAEDTPTTDTAVVETSVEATVETPAVVVPAEESVAAPVAEVTPAPAAEVTPSAETPVAETPAQQ